MRRAWPAALAVLPGMSGAQIGYTRWSGAARASQYLGFQAISGPDLANPAALTAG